MIVAERGSAWTPWVERFRLATPEVRVVLQHRGESMSALAMRVRTQLAELERHGLRPERAVIVGGGRTDGDALAARSGCLRAITSGMARGSGGEVLLDDSGSDRLAMAGLALAVNALTHGTGVTVAHVATDSRLAKVA